ncbi:MAG: M48 family metallopeptidase [Candidatus Heimdallarchaeaceae archaeon]
MITQDSIKFGEMNINYDIIYSDRRKNATIAVYPLKQVEIRVPFGLEQDHIQKLVKKKAEWIIKQILWFDEIMQIDCSKEYVNGETYLYLGRQYRLKIIKSKEKPQAKLIGRHLLVSLQGKIPKTKEKKIIKAAVWKWYKQQANKKIAEAVEIYSEKLGIKTPKFTIKNQYKRWGSCTKNNILNFNFRIVMAPITLLHYVVAHELCHIKYKDHSKQFWALLKTVMPDYEQRKERLRREGTQFVL